MPTATLPPPSSQRLLTVEEFWDFVHRPENENKKFELIRGEVIEMSSPTRMHGYIAGNIGRIIGNWTFETRLGYSVTNDSGVILDREASTVVGPDVAYYTDAKSVEDVPVKWGDIPPVLAVEVVSPNDRPGKLNKKIHEYLTSGTKVVWIVYYEDLEIAVYRPNRTLELFKVDDIITGEEDLPGFQARVSDLLAMPISPPPS